MDFNSARIEIEKPNFKFWFIDEFEDEKTHADIMDEMPNAKEYEKKKNDLIEKDINKVTPELREFYRDPLLSKIQEYHLFRKLNFLKYKASRYYRWYLHSNLSKMKNLFVQHMHEAHEVRNQIVCCNTRLAAQVYRKRKDYYSGDVDNLLSDCFANIIKAVDGFDFRRGFKFSTYCTWVIMNNSLRDHQPDKKFQEKFSTNTDDLGLQSTIDEKQLDQQAERERMESLAGDISMIIEKLHERDYREAKVIEEYFGLKDGKKKTLKEISDILNITKERVRQIKNTAIEAIQNMIVEGVLNLDSEEYF